VDGPALDHMLGLARSLKGVQDAPESLSALLNEFYVPFIDEKRKLALRQEIKETLAKLRNETLSPRLVLSIGREGALRFPLRRPFHPLHRPDLVDLVSICEPLFDVRILVVTEDPRDSLEYQLRHRPAVCKDLPMSSRELGPEDLRCSNTFLTTRIVEGSLVALSNQLEALSHIFFRILSFQDAVNDPALVADPFFRFFDFAVTVARQHKFVASMKTSPQTTATKRSEMDDTDLQRSVSQILGGIRGAQWPHLMREELNLLWEDTQTTIERCFVPKLGVAKFYHTKMGNYTDEQQPQQPQDSGEGN
jgi:hypothetical protein